jgi:two-component system, OmpR family, response regulator RegX3
VTRILIVEDEPSLAEPLAFLLEREGYEPTICADGLVAVAEFDRNGTDLVLLDLMLPGLSGTEVCREIRSRSAVPIIMLTAKDSEIDIVVGLELGADDYVTKPFSARELVARVHAILRRTEARSSMTPPSVVALGLIEVDTGRREVRKGGTVVPLATREFDLLSYLVDNLGLALSRRQLLNGVWGDDWYGDERTVDVHVRQLRKKLGEELPLTTIWGVGYRMA